MSVWRDEGTKSDISLEELKNLRPLVKKDGMVTPGTASQISDGAAAALLMDRKYADKHPHPLSGNIKRIPVFYCRSGNHGTGTGSGYP